ncbi:apses-domain-containing protein [Guyanagaster necrorhizus]|uniref:Apses-domain-containing protein n=1 Tax=Guyanagaster necrorhizus TaxID=856835 RepID=A0A9P7VS64_9AGAR|nr:apses-domain-containing protein [Guyanagaster necrorhizus MCA 3950]KAG7444989.1 apses-domain-containing protein [Guyanagaster necrorhizus MCA 3950]
MQTTSDPGSTLNPIENTASHVDDAPSTSSSFEPPPHIYDAAYSSVLVDECMIKGIPCMRRRDNSWVNATQILKVAGVNKGKRTVVMDRRVLKGQHEIIQGGHGKYQGTWIPLDRGRELARRFHVDKLFTPLFDYTPKSNPFDDDLPEGPSSLTSGVSSLSITGSNNNMAAFISGLSDPSRVRGDALRMLNQARSEGLFSMMTADYLLTQPTLPPPPPSPPLSLKRKRMEEKVKEPKPDKGKKKDITGPAKRPKKKPPKPSMTEYIQYTPGVKKAERLPRTITRTLRDQRSRKKSLSRFPPPPGYEDVSFRAEHSSKRPSEGHVLRTRKELFCSGPPPSSEDDATDEKPTSRCSTPRPSASDGGNEQNHDMEIKDSTRINTPDEKTYGGSPPHVQQELNGLPRMHEQRRQAEESESNEIDKRDHRTFSRPVQTSTGRSTRASTAAGKSQRNRDTERQGYSVRILPPPRMIKPPACEAPRNPSVCLVSP